MQASSFHRILGLSATIYEPLNAKAYIPETPKPPNKQSYTASKPLNPQPKTLNSQQNLAPQAPKAYLRPKATDGRRGKSREVSMGTPSKIPDPLKGVP